MTDRSTDHRTDHRTDRRAYIDPTTNEVLLLEWKRVGDQEGWIPAVDILRAWQTGLLEVCKPSASPEFITMPDRIRWPCLTPEEERNILRLLNKPWISPRLIVRPAPSVPPPPPVPVAVPPSSPPPPAAAAAASPRPPVVVRLQPPVSLLHHPLIRLMMPMPLTPFPAAAASASPFIVPTAVFTAPAAKPAPTPFPRHLIAPVLAHAEATKAICPISLEPITKENATVTSCGHIFQTEAIATWLTDHTICPECRAAVAPV